MREIKFRVWDTKNKCWLQAGQQLLGYLVGWDSFDFFSLKDRGQYEIMQYTGLKDENGVEIYEKDIIAFMDGHDGSVYGECGCIGQVIWDDETLSFQVTNWIEAESYEVLEDCEVIGNIYENPELLESENNVDS